MAEIAFIPAFILSFLLCVTYVIFYKSQWLKNYSEALTSFASGLLIAVIFAEILPLLFVEASRIIEWRFLSMFFLIGFLFYHIMEKHTYHHARNYIRHKELTYVHSIGFFIDNFIKGVLLYLFFTINQLSSSIYLLFFPLLIRSASSALNFRNFSNNHKRLPVWVIASVSLSIIFGTIAAYAISMNLQLLYASLSIISGGFTYFVIRDEIPQGEKGKPIFFVLGVLTILVLALFFE